MPLNINGTTGISGVDGSVSAPALTGTDSNTGITFPAADTIKFSTGGVERMSITNTGITGITTTEAAITGKLSSSSHMRQTVASGLTYNNTTGDVTLGTVASATASNIKSLVCFVQCVHSSPSASHGYLGGWLYQYGKTYNVDGAYFDVRTYNQYVLHFPTTVIIPWDPSGTQSLSLYITQSTETGTNNYFNVGVDSKLENV